MYRTLPLWCLNVYDVGGSRGKAPLLGFRLGLFFYYYSFSPLFSLCFKALPHFIKKSIVLSAPQSESLCRARKTDFWPVEKKKSRESVLTIYRLTSVTTKTGPLNSPPSLSSPRPSAAKGGEGGTIFKINLDLPVFLIVYFVVMSADDTPCLLYS